MDYETGFAGAEAGLIDLFARSFTDSEGEQEGETIRRLVTDLLQTTPADSLFVFSALKNGARIGAIVFSPLVFAEDDRAVFLMSPVAVKTEVQGQGIGQALLNHGLSQMGDRGFDTIITYGAPAYYGKVGFQQISAADAQPPYPLGRPHGWLGQSLSGAEFPSLKGPSKCVPAFDTPAHW